MEEPFMAEFEGKRHIRKVNLKVGAYYYGRCRNATVARWDGTHFWYWRTKFGATFLESIRVPEDDDGFDLFIAVAELNMREIPIKGDGDDTEESQAKGN